MLQGRPAQRKLADEPDVELLLDVDREYREKAASGKLQKIAPRRFNPAEEAWLTFLAHDICHIREIGQAVFRTMIPVIKVS